jgi:hypothetical protein
MLVFGGACLLAIGGCGTPNPIVARDPVPRPPPGYRVVCQSTPFVLNAFFSSCEPVQVPVVVRQRAVVRALY